MIKGWEVNPIMGIMEASLMGYDRYTKSNEENYEKR